MHPCDEDSSSRSECPHPDRARVQTERVVCSLSVSLFFLVSRGQLSFPQMGSALVKPNTNPSHSETILKALFQVLF